MQTASRLHDPRRDAPGIARHEGTWNGVYRYYDVDGQLIDEHASTLHCRFPDTGPWPYHQTNHYRWADGRTETREFPADIRDGKLIWQGGLIHGWAASVALDNFDRTTLLYWVREDEPETYLYEMIQLSDCGNHRSRVWQWFQQGRLVRRTLIDETRVNNNSD